MFNWIKSFFKKSNQNIIDSSNVTNQPIVVSIEAPVPVSIAEHVVHVTPNESVTKETEVLVSRKPPVKKTNRKPYTKKKV